MASILMKRIGWFPYLGSMWYWTHLYVYYKDEINYAYAYFDNDFELFWICALWQNAEMWYDACMFLMATVGYDPKTIVMVSIVQPIERQRGWSVDLNLFS